MRSKINATEMKLFADTILISSFSMNVRSFIQYPNNGYMTLESVQEENISHGSPTYQAQLRIPFKKDKTINIRLSRHKYGRDQRKAAREGLYYPAMISGLIHKYVEGDLSIKIQCEQTSGLKQIFPS